VTRTTIWIVVALAGFATSAQSISLGSYYITGITITDLGDLDGVESEARDINNNGTVVGWSKTGIGLKHAFIAYPRLAMSDLGSWFAPNESEANGVNSSNVAVGAWWVPGHSSEPHAAHWNGSGSGVAMSDVMNAQTEQYCTFGSRAYAINNAGTATGYISLVTDATPSDNIPCGLFPLATNWTNPWSPSFVWNFELWNGAKDINNNGVVVGYAAISSHDAVRWASGTKTSVPAPPYDVAEFHYGGGMAYGVNDAGRIVGYMEHVTNPPSGVVVRNHAIYWNGSSSTSTDLGTLMNGGNSVAREINEQGFVAGYANRVNKLPIPNALGYIRNAGFIWHPHFGMKALPQLPGSLLSDACEAYALNDRKSDGGLIQVVGYCAVGGSRRAVRWDVTTAVTTPVCPTPTC
jgi:probable HAF family extracellular repeat protein